MSLKLKRHQATETLNDLRHSSVTILKVQYRLYHLFVFVSKSNLDDISYSRESKLSITTRTKSVGSWCGHLPARVCKSVRPHSYTGLVKQFLRTLLCYPL